MKSLADTDNNFHVMADIKIIYYSASIKTKTFKINSERKTRELFYIAGASPHQQSSQFL